MRISTQPNPFGMIARRSFLSTSIAGRTALTLACALCASFGTPAHTMAQASGTGLGQDDYAIESRSWNGLSELVAIASELGLRVEAPRQLDLNALKPADSLLVVFPQAPLPRADFAAFLHDGGRIAIADDFGAAESWLASFEISRSAAPIARASDEESGGIPRLRDNRSLLIATPRAAHPLTREVAALVVNHPAVLRHASLEPVFELGDSGGAIVLTGAVGEGRLIALSDPSALINNMLELTGNRQFAQNLLSYLAPRDGRLYVVTPATAITGRYGLLEDTDRFALLSATLARLAHVELPSSTLRWLSAMLALTMLLAAITAVPRRDQYLRAMIGAQPASAPVLAGEAGTVRHFARGDANLLVPLLHYRQGFDHALRERLRIDAGAPPSALLEAARRNGLAADGLAELKRLLDELGALALASDASVPPHVGSPRFRAMVDAGERMLSALESRAARNKS